MPHRNLEILASLGDLRLAVVGDAMVDRFLWGEVDRISPEAPVPVVRLRKETVKLGGAANVAANIRALGAEVELFAAAGAGETSRTLAGLLDERKIAADGLLRVEGRRTTLKTRIIAHHQQVVRADVEADTELGEEHCEDLVRRLRERGPFDAIVLSDYGKGVLTDAVLSEVLGMAAAVGTPAVVDPKNGDYAQYRGCSSLTPNQMEADAATAIAIVDPDSLQRAARTLLERTGARALLVTRGEHGVPRHPGGLVAVGIVLQHHAHGGVLHGDVGQRRGARQAVGHR